jgi:hypothetical protein
MCSYVRMCIQQFRPGSVVCIVLYYVHTTWAMSKLLCSTTIIGFVHLVQGFTRVVHNYFWINIFFSAKIIDHRKKDHNFFFGKKAASQLAPSTAYTRVD